MGQWLSEFVKVCFPLFRVMKNQTIRKYNIWMRLLVSFIIVGVLFPVFSLNVYASSLNTDVLHLETRSSENQSVF